MKRSGPADRPLHSGKVPARFSFAHGGKDGHPFPVPTKVYDKCISVLEHAVKHAKIGNTEKTEGLKKLYGFVDYLEKHHNPTADVQAVIEKELKESKENGGRTVFR